MHHNSNATAHLYANPTGYQGYPKLLHSPEATVGVVIRVIDCLRSALDQSRPMYSAPNAKPTMPLMYHSTTPPIDLAALIADLEVAIGIRDAQAVVTQPELPPLWITIWQGNDLVFEGNEVDFAHTYFNNVSEAAISEFCADNGWTHTAVRRA